MTTKSLWLALAIAAAAPAPALAADQAKPLAADEYRLLPGALLGKRLFEDTTLSEPGGLSCASCHDPATAFRGNNHSSVSAVAAGSRPGVFGDRKVPSVMYMFYSPPFVFAPWPNDVTGEMEITPRGGQFWDGRAIALDDQVQGPLLNPREMNNPSKQAVVEKVRAGAYASLARDVFGEDAFDAPDVFDKLASAIASYEATPRFKLFSSRFDDWLEGRTILSDQEYRGFQAFVDKSKGNCLSCHDGGNPNEAYEGAPAPPATRDPNAPLSRNPKDWFFTDFTYDVLGAPRNMAIADNADPARFDLGLCKRPGIKDFAPENFDIESLCGAFKTPGLRNVAAGGPYLHNGVFASLRDVVAFYFTRDTNPERWYPKGADGAVLKFNDLPARYRDNVNTKQVPYDRHPGESPRADDADIDDIVAFLKTLTDAPFVEAAAGRH